MGIFLYLTYNISQEICTRFLLCCGYTLTDFPISTRLTSLALWQSSDCLSASKATLMNMDKYFMLNHYERLHNHNKAKHNKTVCIFIGIYCTLNKVLLQNGRLTKRLNSLAAGRCCSILKELFSNPLHRTKVFSIEYHRTSPMRYLHWFR